MTEIPAWEQVEIDKTKPTSEAGTRTYVPPSSETMPAFERQAEEARAVEVKETRSQEIKPQEVKQQEVKQQEVTPQEQAQEEIASGLYKIQDEKGEFVPVTKAEYEERLRFTEQFPDETPPSPSRPLLEQPNLPEGEVVRHPDGTIEVIERFEGGTSGSTLWRETPTGFIQLGGSTFDTKGSAYIPNEMSEELADALVDFSKLEGREQFDKAIDIGLVPAGSKYIEGEEGSWSYLTPEQQELAKAQSEAVQEFESEHFMLPGGAWIRIKDFNKLPPELRAIGMRYGYDGMKNAIDNANKEYELFEGKIESGEVVALPDGKYVTKESLDSQPEGARQIILEKGFEGLQDLTKKVWVYKGKEISDEEHDRIINEWEAERDRLAKEGKMYSPEWFALGTNPADLMALNWESAKTVTSRAGIGVLSFVFPPAKSLYPEYTIKDVSAIEWGLGAVNVALIGAAFAPGAILASTVGKLAIPSLGAAGGGLITYQTAKNWDDLSTVQKAVGVGGAVLYALPVLAIPARGIKFTSTRIPTAEGEVVAWRGLSLFDNPTIGRSGGKWVVGARNLTIPEARLIESGYKPEVMLDTKVFVNEAALERAGFSKTQIDYLTATLKDRNLFAGSKSPYLSEETLLDPTAKLDADEVALFLQQMNKYRSKVDSIELFGSQSMKAQLAPELRAWRKTHDLDIHTSFSLDEAIAFTEETVEKLRKLAGNRQYRVSPESPIRIEKYVEGKWEHIDDLKSSQIDPSLQTSDIPGSKLDYTNAYSYGRLVEEPVITVEYPSVGKLDIMSLSESGVRKSDTILRVRQLDGEVAFRPPERGISAPGVPKDAADFYVILRTFKGQELADEWASLWAKAMGYADDEIPKVLPKITRAMQEVSAETPSNIIGYRISPTKVMTGEPTITLSVPSTLSASVSGALRDKITSPVSPYNIASGVSDMIPSVSSLKNYSLDYNSPSVASPTSSTSSSLPSPLGVSGVPSGIASASISGGVSSIPSPPTSPSLSPTISPTLSPTPSPSPSTIGSPSIESVPSESPIPVPSIDIITEGTPSKPIPVFPHEGSGGDDPRVVPGSIVWIQGRPKGGAMYKVLPPPYKQEDMFTLRRAPQDYRDMGWEGEGSARASLQVIGGSPPEDVEVKLGWADIKLTREGGILDIDYDPNEEANVGIREETIGMGEGQIPIEEWKQAKEEGVSVEDIKGRAIAEDKSEEMVQSGRILQSDELTNERILPEKEYTFDEPIEEKGEIEAVDLGKKPPSVVWVDTWREIPAENMRSTVKAYHDPKTDTIYAVKGVASESDIEHEMYHSLQGHQDHPDTPDEYTRQEIEATRYAYEKLGEPKHILGKLRATLNDMLKYEYNVDPHKAMAILENELNKIDPPETWRDDFKKLNSEFESIYGRENKYQMLPSNKTLLPSHSRMISGGGFLNIDSDSSEDSDEDRDRKKRLKKDWWDSDFYDNPSPRTYNKTYFGHKLLPPDLGGSL